MFQAITEPEREKTLVQVILLRINIYWFDNWKTSFLQFKI